MAVKHKNVAQVGEVVAAQAFLRAIGANYANTDLIYAVVAWMRTSEGGRANLIGNNPFLLKQKDARYISKTLIRGYMRRGGQTYIVFDSLVSGLKAMAQFLLNARKTVVVRRTGETYTVPNAEFAFIIKAFKAGNPADAMQAIVMSAWDASHYGYDPSNPDPNAALQATSLYKVYASFTGLQMPTPKQPRPSPPRPAPPRDLPSPPLPHPYIDPAAAGRFYRERHRHPDWLD